MTLAAAIEILEAIIQTGEYQGDPLDTPALTLGIAALNYIIRLRACSMEQRAITLPGETN